VQCSEGDKHFELGIGRREMCTRDEEGGTPAAIGGGGGEATRSEAKESVLAQYKANPNNTVLVTAFC